MLKQTAQKLIPRLKLNLLYPQGIPQKLPLKFIKWLLSYGRFIAVIVEIVVLLAFGFRFKLDSDVASYKEQIESKAAIISSLSADEGLIRQTQLRIKTVKDNLGVTKKWEQSLIKFATHVPKGVIFQNLNLEPSDSPGVLNFKIVAKANTPNDLGVLLNSLKKDSALQNISLTSIIFEQNTIGFTITGSIR